MKPLRIGTRGSPLALWQANFVRAQLAQHEVSCEIVVIKTSGDQSPDAPLGGIGVKGVFIKELEEALLGGHVDLAVHSMKDVPTVTPEGLDFPAICKRHDPHDVVLSRGGAKLRELPRGTKVGTGSVRRQAQLRRIRPDLEFADLRGNVDTRIRKLESGAYDAIVLAKAGLERLGLSSKISEVLSTDDCLPAVGQGAIGIETRADDEATRAAVAALDDADTRIAVTAERALLAFLEGGCQVPLGALARVDGKSTSLEGCVAAADGSQVIRDRITGASTRPEDLGRKLGQALVEAGAARLLQLAGRVTHG